MLLHALVQTGRIQVQGRGEERTSTWGRGGGEEHTWPSSASWEQSCSTTASSVARFRIRMLLARSRAASHVCMPQGAGREARATTGREARAGAAKWCTMDAARVWGPSTFGCNPPRKHLLEATRPYSSPNSMGVATATAGAAPVPKMHRSCCSSSMSWAGTHQAHGVV